ncbi:MAG TPA: MOSC N-terminal beta barrel domain-containing protein [Acetobacteraceae bacterium]|nr:MOSC N-terminal beta barrel domain-containing protein [Acetobacteraceae bacterium]
MDQLPPPARVSDLCAYPVKSLRGRSVPWMAVEPWGLAGDRRWMIVDPVNRFLTQREVPAMATIQADWLEDGIRLARVGAADAIVVPTPGAGAETLAATVWGDTVPVRAAGEEAAAWLGAALGRPCRLVYMADPTVRPVDPRHAAPGDRTALNDGFPVLLVTTGSLATLNAHLARPIPVTRFRPNIVVEGAAPWEEETWRRVRIGGVVFRVAKPCARCVVTTIDQETGEKPDPSEPLRTLNRIRRDAREGVMFGQNLIPESPGRIAVGDAVEVLAVGPRNVDLVPPP